VIFVNFIETLKQLQGALKTNCVMHGGVKPGTRQDNIEWFQADKERIIICQSETGGVGISLHDLNGNHPRVSLISPTYNARTLVQVCGRIHRAGAKTPALQKVLYAAGTIEEEVCEKVAEKVKRINMINDGDKAEELFNGQGLDPVSHYGDLF
jgi:superfamily II DNA or RNA helicase